MSGTEQNRRERREERGEEGDLAREAAGQAGNIHLGCHTGHAEKGDRRADVAFSLFSFPNVALAVLYRVEQKKPC